MTTRATSTTTQTASGSIWRGALIALLLSVVVNQIIRLIAVALINPDPAFIALTTWGPVIFFTLIGVVGATVVYALLRRFTANPNRTFTIVASVVLVVSLIPDVLMAINPASAPLPGATPAAAVALALMHFTTAYFAWRFLAGGRA